MFDGVEYYKEILKAGIEAIKNGIADYESITKDLSDDLKKVFDELCKENNIPTK